MVNQEVRSWSLVEPHLESVIQSLEFLPYSRGNLNVHEGMQFDNSIFRREGGRGIARARFCWG